MNLDPMNPDFWNERYGPAGYAYGAEPNAFLKAYLDEALPGTALFPAEGEGRNAVYAAKQGWRVEAFDQSLNARDKALALAKKAGVEIHYQVGDAQALDLPQGRYDLVALAFFHLPVAVRPVVHRKLVATLAPGGRLVLEGFAKSQVGKPSGGPKVESMLFSLEELEGDFRGLEFETLRYASRVLDEGPYHQGEAELVQIVARKPEP